MQLQNSNKIDGLINTQGKIQTQKKCKHTFVLCLKTNSACDCMSVYISFLGGKKRQQHKQRTTKDIPTKKKKYKKKTHTINCRQIWIDSNFYNSNVKRWIALELLINIDLKGQLITNTQTVVLNIELYNLNSVKDTTRAVLEILLLIVIY